jgi:hypothetical protein
MNFLDWQTELEKQGYVVTADQVTTKRGDVLAGKDPYGGYYVNDSMIQDIVSKKPNIKKQVKKTVKKVAAKATELVMERARDKNGHFIADDPTTEVNEAWVVKNKKK